MVAVKSAVTAKTQFSQLPDLASLAEAAAADPVCSACKEQT